MSVTGEVPDQAHLRVLVANEDRDRLDAMAEMVEALGHVVAARTLDVSLVGAMSAAHATDIDLLRRGRRFAAIILDALLD